DRLHPLGSLTEVHETLEALVERELVQRLPRRPGQKEERYVQLLSGESAADGDRAAADASEPLQTADDRDDDDALRTLAVRVDRLERELAALRDDVRSLER